MTKGLMSINEILADFDELTETDIYAALKYVADKEKMNPELKNS